MKNIDVEIYLNQLITFFEKNPNDLTELIGNSMKDMFFDKVRIACTENVENGDEVTLTNQQLIDIVLDIKGVKGSKEELEVINKIFVKNKFGTFCLN
jgi:uncharacterized protein with gpF-like domain